MGEEGQEKRWRFPENEEWVSISESDIREPAREMDSAFPCVTDGDNPVVVQMAIMGARDAGPVKQRRYEW